jgi:hypothetical protein
MGCDDESIAGRLDRSVSRHRSSTGSELNAVLIVNPIPDDRDADSAYVVDETTALRRRLMPWRRNVVRTIPLCPGNFCGDLLSDSAELVRERVASELASVWLEKALRHGPDSSLFVRGNAFLALALLYQVEEVDGQLRDLQTCELLDREVNLLTRARAVVAIAQGEHALVVEQVIQGLDGYEELVPQLSEILGCSGEAPS